MSISKPVQLGLCCMNMTLKKEHKIKGKNLFKGTRAVLTGRAEGPDLKRFVALTPLDIISTRLQKL